VYSKILSHKNQTTKGRRVGKGKGISGIRVERKKKIKENLFRGQ
jgi:hypothetical protein